MTNSTRPQGDAGPKPLLLSATILMLRDGADGLEVFMVKRHHQIDFAAGALVFPGGKVAKGDRDPELGAHLIGAEGLDDNQRALQVGAIREAFEEAGLFLARDRHTGDLVGPERLVELQHYRAKLDREDMAIGTMLAQENLTLDLSLLVPFAHWITPEFMPKRFDTHFYLAHVPHAQIGAHDGSESVDSVWIRPAQAIADAEAKKLTIIFPTRMNLQKLSAFGDVASALAAARADKIVTVLPWVEPREGKPHLIIPPEAGYGLVAEPLERLPR